MRGRERRLVKLHGRGRQRSGKEATPFSCKYDVEPRVKTADHSYTRGTMSAAGAPSRVKAARRGERHRSPRTGDEEGENGERARPTVKYISRCVTSRCSHKSRRPPVANHQRTMVGVSLLVLCGDANAHRKRSREVDLARKNHVRGTRANVLSKELWFPK